MAQKNISRRDFLKGSVASAATLAAAGLLGSSVLAEESAESITWDKEFDVVIAGAGGTGVCAAAAACEAGASAVIFEKSGRIGGTTTFSGGVMQAAGTKWQKEFTDFQDDTPETHAAEWIAEGEGHLDEDLVKDLANGAPGCLEWLADTCGIEWTAVYGHCHVPYVDNSLMADRIHVYKDGGQSGTGQIYVDAVWTYAQSLGATCELNSEVTDLIVEDGKVVGVEVTTGEEKIYVKANKGVILATAGLDHNTEMTKELNPQQYWINTKYEGSNLCAVTNTGDGIRMGLKLGAAFVYGGTIDFCGATGAATDNRTPIFPEFIVNNAGQRFVCEDATYAYHYRAIFQQERATGAPTWMIFGNGGGGIEDAKVGRTDGTSYAWAGEKLDEAIEAGTIITADTIEELAEKIGVNAKGLARTLAAWNEDRAEGAEDPFGRVEGLDVIEAPFYAYQNVPFNLGALGGLKINRDCQVLDVNDNVIEGLYAAGLNAGGWVGPYYPGSGTAIIGTCYFGRTAGKAAANA